MSFVASHEHAQSRAQGLRLPVAAEDRAQWQQRLNALPVLRHMGAELDLTDPAVVRLRLVRQLDSHMGGLGTSALNGAVIAGMIDCGISTAGILQFRGRTCGTVHLSIDFMKPVRIALPTLECRVVRRTDSLAFIEARLLAPDSGTSTQASGIVALARLPARDPAGAPAGNWRTIFNDTLQQHA